MIMDEENLYHLMHRLYKALPLANILPGDHISQSRLVFLSDLLTICNVFGCFTEEEVYCFFVKQLFET